MHLASRRWMFDNAYRVSLFRWPGRTSHSMRSTTSASIQRPRTKLEPWTQRSFSSCRAWPTTSWGRYGLIRDAEFPVDDMTQFDAAAPIFGACVRARVCVRATQMISNKPRQRDGDDRRHSNGLKLRHCAIAWPVRRLRLDHGSLIVRYYNCCKSVAESCEMPFFFRV